MSGALKLVDAMYRLDVDDDKWVESLCRRASEIAPPHRGVLVFEYRAQPGGLKVLRECHADCKPEVLRALGAFMSDQETRNPLLSPGFICDYGHSVQPASARAVFDQSLARHGIWDVLGVKTLDDEGRGLWFGINLAHHQHASERERRRWNYVGIHVAAAYRLRLKARRQATRGQSPVRAIDALRELARRRPRKRNSTRPKDLWIGLADGRWTLLDRFDSDGRRYVIARRNDPQWGGPPELTTAERQAVVAAAQGHANKVIAFQLGLPESTVANHLSGAMRKLGARSRVDLVKLVRELAQ